MFIPFLSGSLTAVAALTLATATAAQTAPPCPLIEDVGPPGGPTDLADAMAAPLAPFLDRIADCEVNYGGTATALFRARVSDDPALRPVLRRVVDAWRSQDEVTTGFALVALAVLGEEPDYFVDQVEAALAEGNPQAARYAARVSWYFADPSRYVRLQQIQALYPEEGIELGSYWDFAEDSLDVGDVFNYPINVTVPGLISGLSLFGFQMLGHGGDIVSVAQVGGNDTFTPDNVGITLAFRRLGAADTAAVRAAVEASPAYTGLDAKYPGSPGYVAAYRRAILSAALPGESLTSDTFAPPTDTSLLYPPPVCQGTPATIYVSPDGLVVGGPLAGTPYAGRLVGTGGPDVIVGTDAADVLEGLGGDDMLCGGAGDDALDGGPNTDTADAGAGTDGCDAAETTAACDGAIPVLTDVRPFTECIARHGDGSFTVRFGYDNLDGHPGRVAPGRRNLVMRFKGDGAFGEQIAGASPQLFALPSLVPDHPGQTPGAGAFSVDVPPGICGADPFCSEPEGRGGALWTLLGQTASSDDADVPDCPAQP